MWLPIPRPNPELGVGESDTVSGEFLPSRSAFSKERVFSRAAHGEEGRHSTPERVLRASGGLARANLLKAEQLKKKSLRRVAVRQPQVSAGELVDF
jgi:hypothetical protein